MEATTPRLTNRLNLSFIVVVLRKGRGNEGNTPFIGLVNEREAVLFRRSRGRG
jgi:hypothetical protein